MPEHYTKATVSASFWCKKCGKETLHAVHDGRRGRCYACTEKLDEESRARAAAPALPSQGSFEFTAAASHVAAAASCVAVRPTAAGAHQPQPTMSRRQTPNHRRVPRDFKGGHHQPVYG